MMRINRPISERCSGSDNELYGFYPPTLEVKLIGIINCPAGFLATPFSMAVDRKGIAWILFNDGTIFHVDVKDASCVATGFQAGQEGFQNFGMGFVANNAGSSEETLYVADYFGTGLGKIDTKTLTLTTVGPWDKLAGNTAELTGTGDARLFGFFSMSPINVAEIDKNTGNILSQAPQPSVNIGGGWAFAFWGGDFWLFTSLRRRVLVLATPVEFARDDGRVLAGCGSACTALQERPNSRSVAHPVDQRSARYTLARSARSARSPHTHPSPSMPHQSPTPARRAWPSGVSSLLARIPNRTLAGWGARQSDPGGSRSSPRGPPAGSSIEAPRSAALSRPLNQLS